MDLTHKRPSVGVGVLIYNSKNQLLLGQRVSSHNANTWSPVGGHLEYGETFEECAIREAFEEAGIVVTNPQLVAIVNDFFETEQKHYVSLFVKVHVCDDIVPIVKEPHKTQNWQWFDQDHLPSPLFLSLQKFVDGHFYPVGARQY